MASSLFQSLNQKTLTSKASQLQQLRGIVGMLRSKNPDEVAQNLARMNPQFRAFYAKNINRPIADVAAEHGVDLDDIKAVLKSL